MAYDNKQQRFAYGINELDSTITRYLMDQGKLLKKDSVSTIPEGWEGVQPICKTVEYNNPADIHVSPDNKFVYGSNRGHESIVVFAIDQKEGELSLVEHTDIEGSIPRNFGISPDGKFLLVACQDTHTVNTFAIDRETGKLTPTGHKAKVPSPTCVCFAPSKSYKI